MILGRPVVYSPDLSEPMVAKIIEVGESNVCKTIVHRCRILESMVKNIDQMSRKQISLANCLNKDYASRIAKIYTVQGLSCIAGLNRSPNSDIARLRLDNRAEGFLISLACTPPPSPHARWTVALLTKEFNVFMESNGLQGNFSKSTVWRALNRNELQPHRSEYWCIPEVTPEFISRMEKVLHIYSLPYNSSLPVVCMDEAAIQLVRDLKPRLEAIRGESEKLDYEYVREGSKNIFVFIEPKTGQYYVRVTDSHTAIDWAYEIRNLVNNVYADAKKVLLIMDNLATHKIESLYKAFPAEEARQIVERIQIIHTPVHASWLNMAEIGINVMKIECIGNRFRTKSDVESLPAKLNEWQELKNSKNKPFSWQFTVEKARDKPHLYKINSVESTLWKYDQLNVEIVEGTDEIDINSLSISTEDEDENVIDLVRSVDSNGNEYWSISLEKNKICLKEQVGKRQIVKITGQKNTRDGWSIPFPSNPRIPNEGKKPHPLDYDWDFMAHGEDVIVVYNEPYDQKHPVVCICKRPLDLDNSSQNTWVANLHPEPKLKQEVTKESKEAQCIDANFESDAVKNKDSRLGITIMYEPHTGRKVFHLSDWSDDLSWAEAIHKLVDDIYPEAESICLIVCKDDINKLSTTEQLFTVDDALRFNLKLDVHSVPEKARWLNFAENELISVCRQCMLDKVSTVTQVRDHLIAWQNKKSFLNIKLTLNRFRRVFANVYKPQSMFSP